MKYKILKFLQLVFAKNFRTTILLRYILM